MFEGQALCGKDPKGLLNAEYVNIEDKSLSTCLDCKKEVFHIYRSPEYQRQQRDKK